MPDDPRETEWEQHCSDQLAKRRCPYSGGMLTTLGEVRIPEGTLSCHVCDCFGFDPTDERIGAGNA